MVKLKNFIIEALDIGKEIDGHPIFQNISFKCVEQSATAISGGNGTGKSTLLKTIAGIYEPTKGKIIMNKQKIGYVLDQFPENIRFKLMEYLKLVASFYGISKRDIHSDLFQYIHLFGLEPFLDTPIKQCSKGTKQKLGILQAILAKPDILLLDEPLSGLDNESQQNLLDLLEKLKKQITIIFTSHEDYMVEKLADQIIYVESGEISFNKKISKAKKLIKVDFSDKEIFEELDLREVHFEGKTASVTVDSSISDQILLELLNRKCSVLEVREKRKL
ncbi:ABC transporter ATP-binding protein [Heyndrickxia sporothermodurans]|nr:ABC transporter ATP-binding protein [Heyndrickxia sporothermodurans]